MSKQGYIARYFNIVSKLSKSNYSSFDDLYHYLKDQFDMMKVYDDDLEFNFSKRTLQRDIREIRTILGIDIVYSRANKGYYIVQDNHGSDLFLKTIEEINSFSAVFIKFHNYCCLASAFSIAQANWSAQEVLL